MVPARAKIAPRIQRTNDTPMLRVLGKTIEAELKTPDPAPVMSWKSRKPLKLETCLSSG
jgi:hypothetical protein